MLNKHNEQNEFIKKIFLCKVGQRGYFFEEGVVFLYGSEFPQPPPDIDLSEVKEEKRVLFVMTMK